MGYLSSVASTQTKDKLGSIQFLEDCAIVEDLGGHVRYAGRFLKHRVPKWSADVLQTLITSTSAKRLSVGIVRDKVSTYPCVAYESDDFVLTFSRFTLPMIVCPSPLMDSGISCQIGTLRNIARIPMEMKSEIHDYYDDSITLYLVKEGDTDVFRAKLGAKEIQAVDYDDSVLKIVEENLAQNKVQDIVSVAQSDLMQNIHGKAQLVIANIIADIIIRLFDQLDEHLEPGGTLLTSGIIEDRIEDVLAAAEAHGYAVAERMENKGWACITFRRKADLQAAAGKA